MKKYTVSLILFISLFINGHDDHIESKDKTKMDLEVMSVDNPITQKLTEQVEVVNIADKKNQEISKKLVKAVTKKLTKVSHKKDHKIVAVEIKSNIETKKHPLDLSVPFTISSAKNIDFILKSNSTSYLPDLFVNKKNNSVQLVGKFIKREEVILGKEVTTDGAGVDFKLSH